MRMSTSRHHKGTVPSFAVPFIKTIFMLRVLPRISQLHLHSKPSSPVYTQARSYTMVRHLIISICCIIGLALLLNSLQDKKDNILSWAGKDGSFKRQQSQFRNWIEAKPDAEFPAEKDRYHLYVSYACPWGKIAVLTVYFC